MATVPEYVFRIPGSAESTGRGTRVTVSATRAAGAAQTLRAREGDVIALTIANGPTLQLHPANAALLLRSQRGAAGRGGSTPQSPDDVIEVEASLAFDGPPADGAASRGLITRVVLQAVELVTGPLLGAAAAMTAQAAVARLEAATSPGVHALQPDTLPSFKGRQPLQAIAPSTQPMLVFVHGTFSSLSGTFGELWRRHPRLVERLFAHYRGGVYGLDHHSVTQTPFQNARLLLDALPADARVHLVTHSRGGLVAETLARGARTDGQAPFDAADLRLLDGSAYAAHRSELAALNQLFAAKRPRIERIVRVASPARGTLLASGRLDAYLGALQWGLDKAGLEVLPELVDFAAAVARERKDPTSLPGLEAMVPGRPVTTVLTRPDVELASELRVVAGDIQGDSVLSWLKVLLTDAYYLTEHDLVVNTNSMYGGQPRVARPSFVFERGAQVSHFRYFSNDSSAQAVVDALTLDAPTQFRPVGALSWDGRASDGLRALRPQIANTGRRPAAFVLPGIMGSHLKVGGRRIWASPAALFFGGLSKLSYPGAKVEPEEPMNSHFGDLMEDLSDAYDVVPFAYDWRLPIEVSAKKLADAVDQELAARADQGLPVRILAHSMGGLLVRAMEIVAPAVWQRFLAQPGARIVLAGTPNRGAFAPLLALSARHPLVNTVELLDTCTSWKELRGMLGNFPGLLQLQALQGGGLDLTQRPHWQALAAADAAAPMPEAEWHDERRHPKRPWGLPTQQALDALRTLRGQLDARLPSYQRLGRTMVQVAGSAAQTIVDLRTGATGVEFVASSAGDGTVPWDSLHLPGVACWRVHAEHGDLLRERSAFRAYRELLDSGTTSALPALEADAARGAAAGAASVASLRGWVPVRSPYPPTLGEITAAALGSGLQPPAATLVAEAARMPLDVQVMHGDLKHVREPLLIGHYRSEALSGAERALDAWLGGMLTRALNLGGYPSRHGEQQVFVNCRSGANPFAARPLPRPEAVIVVGLADEDELTPQRLEESAAAAAIAWSQHRAQRSDGVPATLELASVLVGTGGWRVDVAQAAIALVRGVCTANERLADEGLPVVARLTLVELYGDRASTAHSALADLALQQKVPLRLQPHVVSGDGGRPRPVERGYRGASYDLVHIATGEKANAELSFALHTGRARSELRAQSTQRRLVDRLVASAESEPMHDAQLAHALFNMLVPLELRPALAASTSLFLSLDPDAARIPWELLRDSARGDGSEPFAVRSRMIRTLRLQEFRRDPVDNRQLLDVLVIGEPLCGDDYARLPEAQAEALAVAEQLVPRFEVELLADRPDARRILQTLHAREWRIVHIAGHGDYQAESDVLPGEQRYGGVVLEGGTFLGAKEIAGLSTVPELVFVNCCHLGKIDGPAGRAGPPNIGRTEFAATVAEQLMRIGVRCVVAAGWAVGDEAAREFALQFYGALLSGRTFADAALAGRQAAWAHDAQGNTWAAYQCYGDPGWTLRSTAGEAADAGRSGAPYLPRTPTRADLFVALEELRWEARNLAGTDDAARLATRLQAYEQRDAAVWGARGDVAEAFGLAWGELGDLRRSAGWLERAVRAVDGRATLRAREQLANMRVRDAVGRDDVAAIEAALADLDAMIAEQPTSERLSLRGSAHKRLALIACRARRPSAGAVMARLQAMLRAYTEAAELARVSGEKEVFHPRTQTACAILLVQLMAGAPLCSQALRAALVDARDALVAADAGAPDFWSAVGAAELEVYRHVAIERLDRPDTDIAGMLARVAERDTSVRKWASVRDTFDTLVRVMRLAGADKQQIAAARKLLVQVQAFSGRTS
jgi:CHAT domain